jgi:hypothetical protein
MTRTSWATNLQDCDERQFCLSDKSIVQHTDVAAAFLTTPGIHLSAKAIRTDLGVVGVEKPGPTGTWPIMHFKNGQRVSITWFMGTLKDAYIERNKLMANGGDFRVGIRKEDFWKHKHDH